MVSFFKNSGDMKLNKKPPQPIFQQSNLSEAMAAEADAEDFCCVNVCYQVMLLLGMCHNDLGAACWFWFNVVINEV